MSRKGARLIRPTDELPAKFERRPSPQSMDVGHNYGILMLYKSEKIWLDTKASLQINVETRFPD